MKNREGIIVLSTTTNRTYRVEAKTLEEFGDALVQVAREMRGNLYVATFGPHDADIDGNFKAAIHTQEAA